MQNITVTTFFFQTAPKNKQKYLVQDWNRTRLKIRELAPEEVRVDCLYWRNTIPLSFQTLNHGSVAFGFFNIESDMLLLQQYFFFADSFCAYVSSCADHKTWNSEGKFKIYEIANPANVGDLMRAIHGIRHTGFIGETYRKFPFPEDPALFKQNPTGFKTQNIFRTMIGPYAEISKIPFIRQENRCVRIGDYTFDRNAFQELLLYVGRGGYPQWKDKTKPDYVKAMEKRIDKSSNDIFEGLKFDLKPKTFREK